VSQITRVVFTYHVPIFFIITGYFIRTNTSKFDFVKKKFCTLIIPYIIASLAIIIIAGLACVATGNGSQTIAVMKEWAGAALYGAGDSYSEPFYIKQIGAIWFLLATFWASVFLRFLLEWKRGARIAAVGFLFVVGYWSSHSLFWFPLSIQAGCCAVLFMYAGYLVHAEKPAIGRLGMETKIVLTLLALVIWIYFIKTFFSFWLVHCDMGRGVIDIVGSFCGCYIVILISMYIEKLRLWIANILEWMGKYSLFVLCAHVIELNLFPWYDWVSVLFVYGFPEKFYLIPVVVGKFVWIILITYLCTRWKPLLKLCGMSGTH
jgi:fucose 4-O-acetylase-like acetyltransferase